MIIKSFHVEVMQHQSQQYKFNYGPVSLNNLCPEC